MVNVLLAHMGGIDEIGIFVVPALLAIFALRWAEKRARERAAVEDEVEHHEANAAPSPQSPASGTEP